MKIAIFDPYLETMGGGEKYMLTAALCLSKNHEVSILWDNPQVESQAKERFNIDLKDVKFEKNIFSQNVHFLKKLLLSKKYDAIFYLSDGSIPFVLTKLFIHFQFPIEWIKQINLLTKIKLLRVSKVICNSFFTKKYIDKKLLVNSKVIFPPASEEFAINKELKKENIILSVGRFGMKNNTTFKKQEYMINFFKRMTDLGLIKWQLILVVSFPKSDTKGFEWLNTLTKDYPIKILSNVSSTNLVEIYGKAKIYWHAAGFEEDLTKHPENAEHFGISTVQAMEQGAVPVVINEGGQKEIVNDGVDGYLWNTEEECVNKTEELINNKEKLNQFSEKAQVTAKKFSINTFNQEIERLFS